MKFFTVATALFAVFAVSAVARPYDHDEHRHGYNGGSHYGGDSDDITIHGCNGQGDLTGILPAVLQAGILSDNKKYCIQEVDDVNHH